MAVSKTTGKGKGKTTSGKGNSPKKQPASNGFQTEIILLVILGASIIMMVSNFGLGGFVGAAISNACFGLMGLMAYVFPIALFAGAAFLLSNRRNKLAYKKTFAAFIFFIVMCGLIQLLTEGYVSSTTLKDYYALCSDYRTGGGLIGGAICISTTSAFGTVGGYVIIILVLLVCLILITQHSFIGFIAKIGEGIYELIHNARTSYQEGQPDRQLRKEQKAIRRQEAKEEKLRRLEEELAKEELEEEEEKAKALKNTRKRRPSSEKKEESTQRQDVKKKGKVDIPFLAGTRLSSDAPVQTFEEDVEEASGEEALNEPVENLSSEGKKKEAPPLNFEIHRGGAAEAPVSLVEPDFLMDDAFSDDIEESESEQEPFSKASSGKNPSAREKGETMPPFREEKAAGKPSKNPKSSKSEIESGIVNIQHEISQQEAVIKKEYEFPPFKLLKKGDGRKQGDSDEYLRATAKKLQDTLHNFGVNVKIVNVSCGPTVTRYELQPEQGVKVSKIVGLADDIKLNLATPDIRIEAPIPGKAAVGIEVPNKENSPVMLRDLLQSEEFRTAKSSLSFAVGKDIAGKTVVTDIAKMPHLLIAGATGSGKSVCINTLIMSILYKAKPEDVKLIMIDPKVVELSVYNGIPHLFIPVVTDPKKAAGALNWAVTEMTSRYNTFAEYGVRNLGEYNKKIQGMRIPEGEERPESMPQIVIIVDELADLMMVAPGDVEDAICRLAQLARAAGIHLIIATQRPSVNVITGLIKANMPSRIAFSVSSGVDSRTILDMNGAEKLLGKGDMLFYPQGYQKPARLQGAFVSDEEVSSVVEFLTDQNPGITYDSKIQQQMSSGVLSGGSSGGEERDIYFEEAGKFIIEKERASIGMLQRVLKIGFNRAARIMDQLSDAGVVGPEEGTKPRKILMTMEEFASYMEENP